jgi:hypothetical protein
LFYKIDQCHSLLLSIHWTTQVAAGKKKCIIVAQNSALRYAIGNKGLSKKQTHLQESLYDKAHPLLIF